MTQESFGTTKEGREVTRVTLDNGTLRASLLTLGATLQDLRLAGLDRPLTLGGTRVSDYEAGGPLHYFGAIVGPVANRIRDARAEFDGRQLEFDHNGKGGHVLHGGSLGLNHKVWEIESADETHVLFSTEAADGERGFPGNRRFTAEFRLDGAGLLMTLGAVTDAPTLVNLANHSYWNLGDAADFHGHLLQIDADSWLPTDADACATGEIRAVEGTPMDFRTPRALTPADSIDHNFCLADHRRPLTDVASLTGPDGTRLSIATTEPGLQIYDTRHLPPTGVAGLDGRTYGPRAGVAIEAQLWPNAPVNPAFPSIRLDPGETYEQVTRWTVTQG